MIKPLIATIALALLALPSAANTAEGIAAAEPVAAVAETPSPVAPDGAEISPPAPERNDADARPHKGRCRHGDEKPGHHHRKSPDRGPEAYCPVFGIAKAVLDRLTPEVIAVYETRIADGAIVTGKSDAELALGASELHVSVQKYKALILLADLMARTSKPVPLTLLASLGDGELLRLSRRHAKLYADSLTEEERDSLKEEFKAALKK